MNPPLFKHQKEAVQFIAEQNAGSGALFHEIGLGKTRTAMEVFFRLRGKNPALKLLVICPLSLIEGAWGEDIKKFFPYFTWINLHKIFRKSPCVRVEHLQADVFIINYEAFISFKNVECLTELVHKNSFMAVLDESSKIKNHAAKTTKILLSMRQFFKHRLVMSGTPAPNNETEYWPQIVFARDGILHQKFNPFRAHYFHLARGNEIIHGKIYSREQARQIFSRGFKYEITPAKRRELMERIKPVCHFAKKAECLDLPEQTDENRIVEMTPEQKKIYREMREFYITEINNETVTAEVALAKIMKLRQITGGFAITERGEPIDMEGKNPKLEELKNVLEEAGRQQVIIWAVFRHEIEKIKGLLGDSAVTLYGETEDKFGAISAFKEGKAQYLIAHPRSGGHGLTFVNSSLEVFYSLDYSAEYYEQARGRIHRPGQKNPCTYVHLLCADSIDVEILDVLKNKRNIAEIVYKLIHKN